MNKLSSAIGTALHPFGGSSVSCSQSFRSRRSAAALVRARFRGGGSLDDEDADVEAAVEGTVEEEAALIAPSTLPY
jgi:hypothetical protein